MEIFRAFRSGLTAMAVLGTLASCRAPGAPTVAPEAAHPAVSAGAAATLDAIAGKPNTTWQDTALSLPMLQVRRQALHRSYHVAAPLAGSVLKNLLLAAGASSSVPAYMHAAGSGPAPDPADRLFVVTDSGTLYRLDATTLAVTGSRGGLGAFSKGAVMLSSDNLDVYVLTTGGTLLVLDAATLATRATVPLAGTGFSATAPSIDYATSSVGNGSHDDMWVVANDGTINRVSIDTASGGVNSNTSWSPAAIGYGGTSIKAFPIALNQHVYVGSTTGMAYDVNLSGGSPSLAQWNLAAYTSATGTGVAISAPAAVDMDYWPHVNAIFMPCGDRVCWIDPVANTVTPSLALAVDKATPTQGSLATYTPTSTVTRTFTSTDYVSIKTVNSNPSRWGGTLGNVYNTGVQGTSVKYSDVGASGQPELWTANYTANSTSRLNLAGSAIGTYAATTANEVDVDGPGNCWVSSGAPGGAGNRVFKFSPTGTQLVNVAVSGGTWPAADHSGNCWVTTYNRGNSVVKLNSTGGTVTSAAITNAWSVAVDASDNAWVTSRASTRLYKVSSTGTRSGPYTVGNDPVYVSIDPVTGNVWTANNGANTVSVVSPTGAALNTFTVPAGVWAINFDQAGTPWTCHLNPGSQVCQLNKTTGAIVSSINMSSFGNCYEMAFDAQGNGWVATDGGIIEILNLGNLQDLFASDCYTSLTDGDNSYALVKFKIPLNNFTGFAPYAASFKLTANNTPSSAETFNLYAASPYAGGGTALWTGYPGTPSVDYNNRPAVANPPALASQTGLTVVKDSAYAWPVPTVGDQLNSTDTANAQYAFAFRSTGKTLGQVAHWYSNSSAGATTTKYPTLSVTLANTAKLPANGIASQVGINLNYKIYVGACNAIWELDYSSPAAFRDPAKTLYNLGQLGRSAGPITATAPKSYIFQTTNILQPENGRLIMADLNPATNQLDLNDFTGPLSAGTDKLGYQVNATPATTGIGQQLIYDFTSGSAYMTSTNGYVIRANIMQ